MKNHSKKFQKNTAKAPSKNMAVPLTQTDEEIRRCARNIVPWAKRLKELGMADWQEVEMANGVRTIALIFPEDKWEIADAVLTYKG